MDSTGAQNSAEAEKCLDCESNITGEFCSNCGQKNANPIVTLGDSLSEIASEFFKFDSKLIDTIIPLIVKPGFLTAEYVAGRRTRYIQPIKLYLIVNFFLFLLTSWLDPIKLTEEDLSLFNVDPVLVEPASSQVASIVPPLVMIIVPFFAVLLGAVYYRSKRFYAEHFIFAVHFLTFFMIVSIPGVFYPDAFEWFAVPAFLVYLLLALRRNYSQSWLKTIIKWVILSLGFFILLLIWVIFATFLAVTITTYFAAPPK